MIILERNRVYTEEDVRIALNLDASEYADFASRFLTSDYLTYKTAVGKSHFYFTSEAISKALARANRESVKK